MTTNTEVMEEKREAKLVKQRAYYYMKKNDVEHWEKIEEGQRRRHERRKAEDPTYMENSGPQQKLNTDDLKSQVNWRPTTS